ncbi:MAG: uroporphyrinogen decarboxylase family protein, partial [Clostridiales bacterium]|nr:uroporphyrinogen decarboxylase family protein [Clostridiales bacterium]
FDVMKEYGAKAMLHSCGSIASIIPDIIEIGVDILDPIQVSAEGMNPEDLKRRFGDKITLHGGIDTQHLLCNGTVDEVKRETSRIAKIFSEGSGYILAGTQDFQNDIPVENIVAVYDVAQKING